MKNNSSLDLLKLWLTTTKDLQQKKAAYDNALQGYATVCLAVGEALTPPNMLHGDTIAIRFSPEEMEGFPCSLDTSAKDTGERILYIKKERGRDQPQYLLSWK
jgi:hypothetical protein